MVQSWRFPWGSTRCIVQPLIFPNFPKYSRRSIIRNNLLNWANQATWPEKMAKKTGECEDEQFPGYQEYHWNHIKDNDQEWLRSYPAQLVTDQWQLSLVVRRTRDARHHTGGNFLADTLLNVSDWNRFSFNFEHKNCSNNPNCRIYGVDSTNLLESSN